MPSASRDPKDHPAHIPVEKRLSGDLGSPLELMANRDLTDEQKRSTLETWLQDLDAQPESPEKRNLRTAVCEALASLEAPAANRAT